MVVSISKSYKHPLALLYVGLLFLACMVQAIDPRSLLDTREYWSSVNYWFHLDTLKLDPFSDRWMYVTRRTPGFPFLLMILGAKGTLLLQFVAGILSPFGVLKILNYFNRSINVSLFWVLWLSAPLQFFYTALPMPEIIAQALVVFWMDLLIKKRNIGAGLALLLLILLKPVFLVFMIPLAIVLLSKWMIIGRLMPLKWNKWIPKSVNAINAWSLFIPFLGILAIAGINHARWNVFHISSVSTTNFYEYNRYQTLVQSKGQEMADSIYASESKVLDSMSNFSLEKGKLLEKLNSNTLMTYPFTYAKLHIKGMIQMFLDPGRYDAMVFLKWTPISGFLGIKDGHTSTKTRPLYEWIYMGLFLGVNMIKMSLVFWILIVKVKGKLHQHALLLFCLLLLLLYATAIGSVGTARYVVPVYPLLIAVLVLYFPQKKKLTPPEDEINSLNKVQTFVR
jgi:hypothetical protein